MLFFTQLLVKFNLYMMSVDIPIKIEQMYLQLQAATVDRWPLADIRNPMQ